MRTPYTAVNRKEPSGSSWTLEEYAGYTVCDPRGHKIGRAERLFLNGTRSGAPSCCSDARSQFGESNAGDLTEVQV
jgi:hypothetical protein